MKRAVGYKRFSPKERKAQIYNCVSHLSATKGFATITDIARNLDMTPSTHLKKMALSLVVEDMIDLRMKKITAGTEVYQFYIGANRLSYIEASCRVPWKCSDPRPHINQSVCSPLIGEMWVNCPVADMKLANRRREAVDRQPEKHWTALVHGGKWAF